MKLLANGEQDNLPIEYRVLANELCQFEVVLLRGDRIVVPRALRERVLSAAHDGHPGITMMKNHLRSNVWWPKIDSDVEKYAEVVRLFQHPIHQKEWFVASFLLIRGIH